MTFMTSVRQIGAGAAFTALVLAGAGCTTSDEGYGYGYRSSTSTDGYRTAQARGGMPVVYVGSPPPASAPRASGGISNQSETGRQFQQGQADMQESDQNEWTIPLYSETLRVGKREVEAGEIRLRKVVKTETVNQPVELSREVLVVERVPASGESQIASSAENAFQEREIVIDLTDEEPVIEKQMQLAGRIVARKNTQARQETVQSEVRSEDVALDQNAESDQIKLIGEFNTNMRDTATDQEAIGSASAQSQIGTARGGGENVEGSNLFAVQDPASLIGRDVSLPQVTVQGVLGDRIFQVGPDQNRTFIVRTTEPIGEIQAGDRVKISGTIRDLPDNLTDWNTDQQHMQMLRSRNVYIDATELQKSNQ